MSQLTETAIPSYSLKDTSLVGNSLFEIIDMNGQYPQQFELFLSPHRKDFYFLALVRQGSSRHWIDMVPYTLKPDSFYFTVPHQIHLKERSKSSVGKILCFTDEFLAMEENASLKQLPIIKNQLSGHELNLTAENIAFIEDVMNKMQAEYAEKKNWLNGMLLGYLRVLLIYLSRLYNEQFKSEEPSADRMLLKNFRQLIDEQYTELHDVAAYADQLNISAGHLGEVIKQQSGKTAIELIHERVVLEAQRLLFHTDLSIKEIAWQLGFEDASYFNRFFKRLIAETPMHYRKQNREMYH
ncbi:helix-turn-helix domain-containing protein [Mucilaginibacter flavidus]|uniref:helix-turn-helix domain-containing protein n=1 Tax=Mucilaginibacter flavidus TaxID=2949309 RepID=UPI002092C11C|nr:helix-turn-helix domain-containing protein [Mucilaginibacter flavidus]MCO5946896.1 AraC family transcriptional regulator [Mucilaginibacter flavidus]